MGLSRLSFLKLGELVLTIVCMVMHYNSMIETTDQHSILIINGTFVGFTIILIALFAGYLMSTPINKRIDLYFSAIGCAMYIISGVLILQYWNETTTGKIFGAVASDRKSLGITKGTLSIINGVLFAIDAFFTCRD